MQALFPEFELILKKKLNTKSSNGQCKYTKHFPNTLCKVTTMINFKKKGPIFTFRKV